jgi:hypothetical protein
MKRIETKKDLLQFAIERYNHYDAIFKKEDKGSVYDSFSGITHFYLKDFLTDLLVIQRFAAKDNEDENGEERAEGMAVL